MGSFDSSVPSRVTREDDAFALDPVADLDRMAGPEVVCGVESINFGFLLGVSITVSSVSMSSAGSVNDAANTTLRFVGVECSTILKTDEFCFNADLRGDFVGDEGRRVALLGFIGDGVREADGLSLSCIWARSWRIRSDM